MDLKDYFKKQSREASLRWGVGTPLVEVLKNPKRKMSTGVRTTFDFDSFKLSIAYLESGRAAYAQQTIWLSVSLDESLVLPYSIYDVLAFCEPENFNCYTYTYVDSQQLMEKCFEEISELIKRLVPKFKALLADGVTKNKFITSQREAINSYFGDSVLESSEMVGGAADKLISYMLENFYEAQIEAAVVGTQSFFYAGNEEKALKKLRKSKSKTIYQKNMLDYLENGGKNQGVSSVIAEASTENGYARQKKNRANIAPLAIAYVVLFTIVSVVVLCGLYLGATRIFFGGSELVIGIKENLLTLPFSALCLSVPVSATAIIRKCEKKEKNAPSDVHIPVATINRKKIAKYMLLVAECVAVAMLFFSIFSTTVFTDDKVLYSESTYALSHEECNYDVIEEICIVKGYYYDNKFTDESYVAIKTISGRVIDLYSSSFMSADEVKEKASFFENKGISVIEYESDKDL